MDKLRILIMEDEEIEQQAIRFMLQYHRDDLEEIMIAENGRQGVIAFETFQPHIVLADINMPGMNGLDAIRQMQKIRQGCQYVIVSAYNRFEYAQDAMRLGITEFLVKPIQEQILNEVIDRIAKEYKEREESKNHQTIQEQKLDAMQPVLESDLVYSVASMRSDISTEELLNFLRLPRESACVFVVRGKSVSGLLVETIRKRMKYLGLVCVGELVQGQMVFILLSDSIFQRIQLNEVLGYIFNTGGEAFVGLHAGIGDICIPNSSLSLSYEKAVRAARYASAINRSVIFYDEVDDNLSFSTDITPFAKQITNMIMTHDLEGIEDVIAYIFSMLHLVSNPQKALTQIYSFYYLVYDKLALGSSYHDERILELSNLSALQEYVLKKFCETSNLLNPQSDVRQSNVSQAVIKIIHDRYGENITLEGIAEELNYSFYYLSKAFKQNTGSTFSEYLTRFRIQKARELLVDSDKSIKEIAYATGFRSQGYFAKIFKKYTDKMPSEFRTGEIDFD